MTGLSRAMSLSPRVGLLALATAFGGCDAAPRQDASMGDGLFTRSTPQHSAVTICADQQESVFGIDVSKWQGDIDWEAVADDGVKYAFLRVSDGLQFDDPKFPQNWAGTKANGIIRGAYQFFRQDEDALEQAQYLLDTMGPLEAGDLPPVIDVESTDGASASEIVANISVWIERVESVLGVKPIIYTGRNFWENNVGSTVFSNYPLWVANWGPSCPSSPEQWEDWTFWQYNSNGSIDGINGNVDVNTFDGSLNELFTLTAGGASCGDGFCSGDENYLGCAEDCNVCGVLPANGGIVDDSDACFSALGASQYIRDEEGLGYGGSLKWTKSWVTESPENVARWNLWFAETGEYRVEVYTHQSLAEWNAARYELRYADGVSDIVVDQTATDGWIELGEFVFSAGITPQYLRLEDAVASETDAGYVILWDALRLTRLDIDVSIDPGLPNDPLAGDPQDNGEIPQPTPNGQEPQEELEFGSAFAESLNSSSNGCSHASPGLNYFCAAILLIFWRRRRR